MGTTLLEVVKMVVSLKDSPFMMVSVLALSAIALAAWAIYAVVVLAKASQREER